MATHLDWAVPSVRACGPVAGVRAIGIDDRAFGTLVLRAHLAGDPSLELDERLAALRRRVLADFPTYWPDPVVRLEPVHHGPDDAAIFRDPVVLTGALAWFIGAPSAHAPAIFALAARLAATPTLNEPPTGAWLQRFRHRLGPRPPAVGFESIEVTAGIVTLATGHYGWVSSHEQGWRVERYFSAPCAALPAEPEEAARLVLEVQALWTADTTADVPAPAANSECIFCNQAIAPLDFNSHVGACHACAVAHLGIVY